MKRPGSLHLNMMYEIQHNRGININSHARMQLLFFNIVYNDIVFVFVKLQNGHKFYVGTEFILTNQPICLIRVLLVTIILNEWIFFNIASISRL